MSEPWYFVLYVRECLEPSLFKALGEFLDKIHPVPILSWDPETNKGLFRYRLYQKGGNGESHGSLRKALEDIKECCGGTINFRYKQLELSLSIRPAYRVKDLTWVQIGIERVYMRNYDGHQGNYLDRIKAILEFVCALFDCIKPIYGYGDWYGYDGVGPEGDTPEVEISAGKISKLYWANFLSSELAKRHHIGERKITGFKMTIPLKSGIALFLGRTPEEYANQETREKIKTKLFHA